jgi:hypothetical protein
MTSACFVSYLISSSAYGLNLIKIFSAELLNFTIAKVPYNCIAIVIFPSGAEYVKCGEGQVTKKSNIFLCILSIVIFSGLFNQ